MGLAPASHTVDDRISSDMEARNNSPCPSGKELIQWHRETPHPKSDYDWYLMSVSSPGGFGHDFSGDLRGEQQAGETKRTPVRVTHFDGKPRTTGLGVAESGGVDLVIPATQEAEARKPKVQGLHGYNMR